MQQLNSIIIEGNLVRDPELKETSRGTSLCSFSLATNRYYKSGDSFEKEVSFVAVETWGKLAEVAAENCTKGRGVRIVGRLKQNRWTGQDSKNYSKIIIIAEHIEFKPVFNKIPTDSSALDKIAEEALFEDSEEEVIPAF